MGSSFFSLPFQQRPRTGIFHYPFHSRAVFGAIAVLGTIPAFRLGIKGTKSAHDDGMPQKSGAFFTKFRSIMNNRRQSLVIKRENLAGSVLVLSLAIDLDKPGQLQRVGLDSLGKGCAFLFGWFRHGVSGLIPCDPFQGLFAKYCPGDSTNIPAFQADPPRVSLDFGPYPSLVPCSVFPLENFFRASRSIT